MNDKEWIGMCRREVGAGGGRQGSARLGDTAQQACPLLEHCGSVPCATLLHNPKLTPPHPAPSPPPPPTPPHPRLQVFDDYLRKRASKLGANLINGLFMGIETTQGAEGPITIRYNEYKEGKWLPARLGWLGLRWLMLASVEPACRMRGFSNNWRWPGVVLRAASAAAAAASPSPAAHTSSTHPPPPVPWRWTS